MHQVSCLHQRKRQWDANGDAPIHAEVVVKALVEEHVGVTVMVVVVEDAKETAEGHVLALAGSLVLEVVLVIVGECLAKVKSSWCQSCF